MVLSDDDVDSDCSSSTVMAPPAIIDLTNDDFEDSDGIHR